MIQESKLEQEVKSGKGGQKNEDDKSGIYININ